jgi:PAS domain S-box-containing protein
VTKYWDLIHYPVFDEAKQLIAVGQETKDVTEQFLIRRKLHYTENQLSQVLGNNQIGTWVLAIDSGTAVVDANVAFLFGLAKTDIDRPVPLSKLIKSIHPDDRSRVEAEIGIAIEHRQSYEVEYRTLAGKDDVRTVIARGAVQVDVKGDAHTFSGVVIDITDRKRTERALAESENSIHFMADAMPQLVWVARPDGTIEYFNQQWYDFTGTSAADPSSLNRDGLLHAEDMERMRRMWQRSLKTGEPYEIEYRLYHNESKSYRWVIGRALPFRDASGRITKWYGTCTDIDEQKRATQLQSFLAAASKQLSESLDYKKTLKKVAELGVPDIADWCTVDIYDEDNGFQQISLAHVDPKKISQAIEYRAQNPIKIDDPTGIPNVIRTGKPEFYPYISNEMLTEYITDKDKLAFMQSLDLHSIIITPLNISGKIVGGITFISSDSGRYYTEVDLHMAEELGARISLAMTNAKLYADSQLDLKNRRALEKQLLLEKQKLESRVNERTKQLQLTNEGLRKEITKRHAIEAELQAYGEELSRSNSELEDFAYVASHDLQEPLRKIQAFSNLLTSEYADKLGDGSDYVARMHAAAMRMSTLIEDLLAFSRVSTRSSPLQPVDLNVIAADVVADLETRIAQTGGQVKVSPLPIVQGDPTHMRQLLQNLIGNGLKFHRDGIMPVVTVTANLDDPRWFELHFVDNGIGFDEKYLDKIFAVFQRLHGRDSFEGTGIGLAVCRKIVERYGGSITAHSKINHGATFVVRLPREAKKDVTA